MDLQSLKADWSSATKESGVLCVIKGLITLLPRWCAPNWDNHYMVIVDLHPVAYNVYNIF